MSSVHDSSNAMGTRKKRPQSDDIAGSNFDGTTKRQKRRGSPVTRRCPFFINDPEHKDFASGGSLYRCTSIKPNTRLKQHIQRIHTRPFQCERCGFRGDAGQLRGHKNAIRGCEERPFVKVSEEDSRIEKYMETHLRFSLEEIAKFLRGNCPRDIKICQEGPDYKLRQKEERDTFGRARNHVPGNLELPSTPEKYIGRSMGPGDHVRVEPAEEHDRESSQPNTPNAAPDSVPLNPSQSHGDQDYESSVTPTTSIDIGDTPGDWRPDETLIVGTQQTESPYAGFYVGEIPPLFYQEEYNNVVSNSTPLNISQSHGDQGYGSSSRQVEDQCAGFTHPITHQGFNTGEKQTSYQQEYDYPLLPCAVGTDPSFAQPYFSPTFLPADDQIDTLI